MFEDENESAEVLRLVMPLYIYIFVTGHCEDSFVFNFWISLYNHVYVFFQHDMRIVT